MIKEVCFTLLFSVVVVVLGGVALRGEPDPPREHFGGPVKVLRRIPVTECELLCDNFFYSCLRATRLTDFDLCNKQKNACKLVCQYSNFQRM